MNGAERDVGAQAKWRSTEERLRKAAGRSRGRRRRDANTRRREACQELLRRRIGEIGLVKAAVEELHCALEDKERCIKLTGMETPPSEETLSKYWSGRDYSVPEAERLAAMAAFEARPQAERAQIQKEIRLGELRPPDYLTP